MRTKLLSNCLKAQHEAVYPGAVGSLRGGLVIPFMESPNLHESNQSIRASQIAAPFGGPCMDRFGCLVFAKQPLKKVAV
ncbi:MAG: hypothetical protein HQL97_10295 [Magnetococcales bacterium]|nr:hypothetical protein [Magnetococcales bacterium]